MLTNLSYEDNVENVEHIIDVKVSNVAPFQQVLCYKKMFPMNANMVQKP